LKIKFETLSGTIDHQLVVEKLKDYKLYQTITMTTKKPIDKLFFPALILSLTLGLAPFFPEPHLFGKIRWVLGGANGMGAMDYFDLLLHGSPWVVLIFLGAKKVFGK
jgi:hypothetical protein